MRDILGLSPDNLACLAARADAASGTEADKVAAEIAEMLHPERYDGIQGDQGDQGGQGDQGDQGGQGGQEGLEESQGRLLFESFTDSQRNDVREPPEHIDDEEWEPQSARFDLLHWNRSGHGLSNLDRTIEHWTSRTIPDTHTPATPP